MTDNNIRTIPYNDPVISPDTHRLAIYLSNKQIEIIRNNNDLGGEKVAEKLQGLRDLAWGRNFPNKNKEGFFDAIMTELDKKQQEQLLSAYAKMGYLYEIAALSARDNYLDSVRNKKPRQLHDTGNITPGGGEEFIALEKNKSTKELVEQLNQPVFEVTMTAHPTNVNSLKSMKAQRAIAIALENQDETQIKKAIEDYLKTSIPPLDKNGALKNLSVRDETENMLYSMGNIYEDLPRVYKNYDKALSEHAQKSENKDGYDPTSLNLQVRLGSWGSGGDKDGNKNVTAETTLEAIAMHTKTALEHYKNDLEEIPALSAWKKQFESKLSDLKPLLKDIGDLREDAKKSAGGNDSVKAQELSDRFDDLSKKLADLRKDLNPEKFETDLLAQAENGKNKTEALNLLRRFRVFGFSFGKIEYRETAMEYNRVVEALVPDYKGTPEQRADFLTGLLTSNHKTPSDLLKEKMPEIIAQGAGKEYSSDNVMPIAYHTIKRMQLARDFGDMIKDNVLAECGKIEFPKDKKREPTPQETTSQGLANILEAQFLQRAVEEKGKRAILGIIPLFEETSTMSNVDKIMGAAYENPAHKEQLKLLQGSTAKPTQQIMIAHSDNARRSGSMAARAYIHEAHKKLRALGGKKGINTQFYEGGSITDIYRNGVLPVSKTVNFFETHLFAKQTFQGGDLLAYFNHPASTERIFDRSFGHQARYIEKKDGNWIVTKDVGRNNVIDDIAIEAMKETYNDYTKYDFQNDKMGRILHLLDYNGYLLASNLSSRATGRDDKTAVKKASSQIGAAMSVEDFVKIDKARTIGWSQSQQVAGILPAFLGAEKLEEYLTTGIKNKLNDLHGKKQTTKEEQEFLQMFSKLEGGKLSPKQLHFIYEKSPAYHNAQELLRPAYMLTDLDKAEKIIQEKLSQNDIKEYWQRIKETYKQVAKLTYQTITQTPYINGTDNVTSVRAKMNGKDIMKVESTTHHDKLGYMDFLLHYRTKHPEIFNKNALEQDDDLLTKSRDIASAFQSTLGGRWLAFSDPTCRKHREENEKLRQYA